ncbi:unnamed protein product [Microthlaspi erraticum]|uniref:Uncharacterized protein n=1 Tax=Microthlaspi erraticum TaxID=1685480 RepID=A0A6D2KW87_9BRAS|nr:unnamed protein product [Microthlaspi erraticum]
MEELIDDRRRENVFLISNQKLHALISSLCRLQAAKVLYLSSIDEPPNPTRLCLGDYSKSPKEYFLSLFFSKNRKYPFCLDNSKSPHPAQLPPLLDSSLTATSSHPAQHQSFSSVKLHLAPLHVRPYVLMHFLTDSRSASNQLHLHVYGSICVISRRSY